MQNSCSMHIKESTLTNCKILHHSGPKAQPNFKANPNECSRKTNHNQICTRRKARELNCIPARALQSPSTLPLKEILSWVLSFLCHG